MNVQGQHHRSITRARDGWGVEIIDQRQLPHRFETARLESLEDAVTAIREMRVRGAPLIGATAAYGVCLAARRDPSDEALAAAGAALADTRPTAVNLRWALERMGRALTPLPAAERVARAYEVADEIAEEDVRTCRAIGRHGLGLIRELLEAKGGDGAFHVLTHCNAGWLATVDWGTALAPIYMAHDEGIPVHVWVDETRPRNQGAALTAWELGGHGVDHTVIVDNAGGHLMQRGLVDLVLTGSDRTTSRGGVFNKIGTYLKALAAHDNGIPFYVAVPGPTVDWRVGEDPSTVPIEERAPHEVTRVRGRDASGQVASVTITPEGTRAANPAFDFTPARLVTGLVTERGVCAASAEGLSRLYPERLRGG